MFTRGSNRRSRFVITKGAPRLSNDDKKRAPTVGAECRTREEWDTPNHPTRETPAESGTATPVRATGASSDAETGSSDLKDRGAKRRGSRSGEFTAMPYFAWDNRTPGEMRVWLRTD
ncbi:hypothetical protein [Halegenticoccus soli]|uniref:hypothetical protein n=1 Tax=Halegenticoccus soli TaxID=1985678 RepID=UPI003743E421